MVSIQYTFCIHIYTISTVVKHKLEDIVIDICKKEEEKTCGHYTFISIAQEQCS